MISEKKEQEVERLLAAGEPQRSIRRRTGVGRHTITEIATGRRGKKGQDNRIEGLKDERARAGRKQTDLGVLDRVLGLFGVVRAKFFQSPEAEGENPLKPELRGKAATRYARLAAAKRGEQKKHKPGLPTVPYMKTSCSRCGTPVRAYMFRDQSVRFYDDASFDRIDRCPGCDRDFSSVTVAQLQGDHDGPEFVS